MATGAFRFDAMKFKLFAQRKILRLFGSLFERWNVRRRRLHLFADKGLENPSTAQNRAGAQRIGGESMDRRHADDTSTAFIVERNFPGDWPRNFFYAVDAGEPLIYENVIGVNQLQEGVILLHDIVKKCCDLLEHGPL